jgi:CsoR family transcriptional regulator, copper-sensing transcriptional repressor
MSPIVDSVERQRLLLRLKRVEGQIRAVQAMIEQDRGCDEVVHQLSACRRAIDKAFFDAVGCAVAHAAIEHEGQEPGEHLREVAAMLVRYG